MPRALLVLCTLVSSAALAQSAGKTLKDKEAQQKFNEIERGFTVEMALGGDVLFNSPGVAVMSDATGRNVGCQRGPLSGGANVRIEIGADVASRGSDPSTSAPAVVVTAMMQASNAKAGSDYLGTKGAPVNGACVGSASGDFSTLAAGLAAKVNLYGFADSQDVKRTWIYARIAGGANWFFPNTLIDKMDVLLQAGLGVEFYTRLRHFALGLEANFQMLLLTTTFGVTITPTLRYSF